MEPVLIAIMTGCITGLITWGGMRVELLWLRRDVDLAHKRIDELLAAVRQGRP